jgi:hypothetical protein
MRKRTPITWAEKCENELTPSGCEKNVKTKCHTAGCGKNVKTKPWTAVSQKNVKTNSQIAGREKNAKTKCPNSIRSGEAGTNARYTQSMHVNVRRCLLGLLFLAFSFLPLGSLPVTAAIPVFHTAAAARAWGAAQERVGDDAEAAAAFEREAAIRRATGDPQGADVELRRARRLETDLAAAIPGPIPPAMHLAKWEPVAGCYLGVQDGDGGSADDFAVSAGRPLALAYEYASYGNPFPRRWAAVQAAAGRAIQIAWEPNDIHAVKDDDYLHHWAIDAAATGIPLFLRFGGEMNGAWTPWSRDPAAYRRAFRTVHDVMARLAPNVAMVWAPNPVPFEKIDQYYPGDDVVDWVGISLYVVRYYDDHLSSPAWQDHPLNLIAPIYQKYAARHPICLTEWGVSRRSRVEGANADAFAASRIEDLFAAIKVRFPRLKMVCAYNRDNFSQPDVRPGRRLNDYSLPSGSLAMQAYRQATTDDPYFLSSVNVAGAPYANHRLTTQLPSHYHGPVAVSLSSPSLNPTLLIMRDGLTERRTRPYSFDLPVGSGPLILRVETTPGHTAQTLTLH